MTDAIISNVRGRVKNYDRTKNISLTCLRSSETNRRLDLKTTSNRKTFIDVRFFSNLFLFANNFLARSRISWTRQSLFKNHPVCVQCTRHYFLGIPRIVRFVCVLGCLMEQYARKNTSMSFARRCYYYLGQMYLEPFISIIRYFLELHREMWSFYLEYTWLTLEYTLRLHYRHYS